MNQLFSDISGFISGLTQVDLLLYLSILVLIILIVSLIYLIKNSDEDIEQIEEQNSELNLNKIVADISNSDNEIIEFTNYEKDQEEKAIISYDELIAKNKTGPINYNDEQIIEDNISVKKVDLEHITNNTKDEKTADKIFRYASEEAFLNTLKSLDEILN